MTPDDRGRVVSALELFSEAKGAPDARVPEDLTVSLHAIAPPIPEGIGHQAR
jgi:hypothetical protein